MVRRLRSRRSRSPWPRRRPGLVIADHRTASRRRWCRRAYTTGMHDNVAFMLAVRRPQIDHEHEERNVDLATCQRAQQQTHAGSTSSPVDVRTYSLTMGGGDRGLRSCDISSPSGDTHLVPKPTRPGALRMLHYDQLVHPIR
jgi:hypothetical protein